MNFDTLYNLFLQHPTVTTDSRHGVPGSLFFALKGETFDGNMFAEKALQSGCAYAIVDNPTIPPNERTILVEDVLGTLQRLAEKHRMALKTPIIGITGTNGKTTTKELIAAVLSKKYKTLYTPGNLNNHIGVPLTLLRLTHEHEIAVIEMGANHPGEIRTLSDIVHPDYGLITNIGQAHLEGFGSFEGIIKTKGELYDYIRENNGKIFLNQENELLEKMAYGLEKIRYGNVMRENTFVAGEATAGHPFLSFEWGEKNGKTHLVETHLAGDYNIWNTLSAIAVGRTFNVPPEAINQAISEYVPTNNRSQWKKTARNELIIDAYNANPSSMRAALKNFAAWEVSPKAVILGDMRELGQESLALHADVVKQLKNYGFEKTLLCGEQFSAAGGEYPCFASVEKLKDHLKKEPLHNHHILIKGSHGVHLEKIIELL